jgi:hypothetical protein
MMEASVIHNSWTPPTWSSAVRVAVTCHDSADPGKSQGALMSLGTKAGSYGRAVSQAEQLEATRLSPCGCDVLIRADTRRSSRRAATWLLSCLQDRSASQGVQRARHRKIK